MTKLTKPLLIVMLMLLPLSGCIAVVAGAAAGGTAGYAIAHDDDKH